MPGGSSRCRTATGTDELPPVAVLRLCCWLSLRPMCCAVLLMLRCAVHAVQGMEELKAAKQEMERLVAEGIFTEEQCGLLHGQMKCEGRVGRTGRSRDQGAREGRGRVNDSAAEPVWGEYACMAFSILFSNGCYLLCCKMKSSLLSLPLPLNPGPCPLPSFQPSRRMQRCEPLPAARPRC